MSVPAAWGEASVDFLPAVRWSQQDRSTSEGDPKALLRPAADSVL